MEDSDYISMIVHGKVSGLRKLETRYKTLDLFLDEVPEKMSYHDAEKISEEIAYIRYQKRNGYLKRAIKNNDTLDENSIDDVISKMQRYRDENFEKKEYSKTDFLAEIIDGKNERYIGKRLEAIDRSLDGMMDNIYSLDDLDNLRYVAMKIRNNRYMQRRIGEDDRLHALADNIGKKIERCLEVNRKHYSKMEKRVLKKDIAEKYDLARVLRKAESGTDEVIKSIRSDAKDMISKKYKLGKSRMMNFGQGIKNIFRSRIVKYAAVMTLALGLGAASMHMYNDHFRYHEPTRTEYARQEKGFFGKTLEYLKYHKPYEKRVQDYQE